MKAPILESGIPMPKPFRYPWHEAAVGDSFLFSGSTHQAHKRCRMMSKATGKLFRARATAQGMRVWRVA